MRRRISPATVIYFLVSTLLLPLLVLPLRRILASPYPEQGSLCTQGLRYNGTVCPATIVDYDTAVPPADQATVETAISSFISLLAVIKNTDSNCYSALVALLCADAYPNCLNGVTTLPCKSACTSAVSVCTATFTSLHLLDQLNTATSNCTILSTANPQTYPTTACFVPPAITAASTNQSAGNGGGGGSGGGNLTS
ncbi:hypothetical protein DFJ73DRAFT_756324 [Zopfochytrium polystomum]|nr:hypothetical protein DFJ73DRAFT_756324 [Zopfochytrium polystomum]